ncbi:hypothetical protein D3C78_1468330 [compost metagenome]
MAFSPLLLATSRSISTSAAAASFMPDALPAVTVPSFLNTGLSAARSEALQSKRTCSSISNRVVPLRPFSSIGRI